MSKAAPKRPAANKTPLRIVRELPDGRAEVAAPGKSANTQQRLVWLGLAAIAWADTDAKTDDAEHKERLMGLLSASVDFRDAVRREASRLAAEKARKAKPKKAAKKRR